MGKPRRPGRPGGRRAGSRGGVMHRAIGSGARLQGSMTRFGLRRSRLLLALAALGSVCAAAGFPLTASAVTAPPTPANLDLSAGYDSSITLGWSASAGATTYDIYRGTTAGGEGSAPYASTTSTTFRDANLSTTPIYFYQVSAVNSAGQSARTSEDASKTPPPPLTGGNVSGVTSGSSRV